MKLLLVLFYCCALFVCRAAEKPTLLPDLRLGEKAGHIFVTTNKHHVPFYLLPREIDLPAKLGQELNRNDLAGVFLTTESEQCIDVINGQAIVRNYYRERGRYAVVHEHRISLIDFEVVTSQNDDDRNKVKLVTWGAKAFSVTREFLQELDSLKTAHRKREGR